MIHFALCDDDEYYRTLLSRLLEDYQLNKGSHYKQEIHTFENGDDLITASTHGTKFDIILLDMVMPFINGIETAKELRVLDPSVKIIFFTSSAQYAVASYEVNAFYYIMKDSPKEKLFSVLDAATEAIEKSRHSYTIIKTKNEHVKCAFNEIEYIEIKNKTITIHQISGDSLEVYGSLSDIETEFLTQENFIKTHRSFIVNLDHVKRLTASDLIMNSGSQVHVSRSNYTDVKKQYIASFKNGVEND